MTYKYWEIEIDGPDKTGKDLLCRYLCELSGWRFSINVRGIISQLVYAKKFNRDDEYDMSAFSKNKILILLQAETDDLMIRCKMTNEPMYDIGGDRVLFDEVMHELCETYRVFRYNTSHCTPYEIAKDIIRRINFLEEEKQEHGKIL